jgi:inhibitor of KinA
MVAQRQPSRPGGAVTGAPLAIAPLGDRALVIRVGERISDESFVRVQAVLGRVKGAHPAITDIVPAFASVTVHYEPAALRSPAGESPHQALTHTLEARLAGLESSPVPDVRTVEIPTCYEGDLAPDLEIVADRSGLSTSEVIVRHTAPTYLVQMIGFTPGFSYLAGLDASLATPRRDEPRTRVAAGSVGIGGEQTGIYATATPGGWNIIGATPRVLFDPMRDPAALLRVGDRVRFVPIARERYDAMAAR